MMEVLVMAVLVMGALVVVSDRRALDCFGDGGQFDNRCLCAGPWVLVPEIDHGLSAQVRRPLNITMRFGLCTKERRCAQAKTTSIRSLSR